jgi:hypothetical protein
LFLLINCLSNHISIVVFFFAYKFYGEVDPKFVEEFQDELNKDWHIWDQSGKHHTLTFTMHHIVPYLTDGWFGLCQFLKIEQPREILFTYYGGNTFRITLQSMLTTTALYPSFHSQSTKPNEAIYFDLPLSSVVDYTSELVYTISDLCFEVFIFLILLL